MGTRGYVLKKIFQAFLTLLAVIIFNFFLFRILPADPVSLLTRSQGAQIDAAEQAELRADYGLDKPLFPGQFLDYVNDTLRLDLGESIILRPNEKVLDLFIEFMWPTILLVGTATLFSTIFGIAMGIYAGWRRGGQVRQGLDVRLAGAVLDAGVLAGHAVDPALLRHVALVPEFGPHRRPVRLHRRSRRSATSSTISSCPA